MQPQSTQILTTKVALATGFKEPLMSLQEIGSCVSGFVAISDPSLEVSAHSHLNGFFNTVALAYNNHLHLRLRPDDIWLTVAQGISAHVNSGDNAEKFRHLFVSHEGQMDMIIIIDHLRTNDSTLFHWDQCVNNIVDKTKDYVLGDIADTLLCDFSTTNMTAKTASQIVFMDAMKNYFKYWMRTCCGIPKVTLEGTLEDWKRLQDKLKRAQALHLDGLEQWLTDLDPILQEFVNTYEGQVNEDFWSRIMDKNQTFGSGACIRYTGWIIKFFAYDDAGQRVGPDAWVEAEDFPSGRVTVPFTWNDNGTMHPMRLVSGFIGTVQQKEDDSVAPYIGWIVANGNQEDTGSDFDSVLRSLSVRMAPPDEEEEEEP